MLEHARLYAAIGASIRKARDDHGLTQEKLAEKVGISRSSLTNIEIGRQRVQVHLLYRIADALECEPASLLPKRDGSSPTLAHVMATAPKTTRDWMQQVIGGKQHGEAKRAHARGEGARAPARARHR